METKIPATPAASNGAPATPGSGDAVVTPPSAAAPNAPAAAAQPPVGQVTITTEEYRRLQRADARTKSFERRAGRPGSQSRANLDPNDPTAAAQADADDRVAAAEQRALQAEVKGTVRDLLSQEKYKNIPETTKKLILEKPHMLSEATTLQDAMFDIEDKLDEYAAMDAPLPGATVVAPITPVTRETPPANSSGAPAAIDAGVLEDLSVLTGPARSQAAIRNAFKTNKT